MAHGLSVLLFSTATFSSVATTQNQTLANCLQWGKTNDILPNSPTYNEAASFTFNRRLLYQPAAIVYPNTAQDVQKYVKCAASSGVAVVARSGGHSYGSYDLGGADGSLVVDLGNMTSVVVHDDGTAYAQTGNKLSTLAQQLWDQGKRSIPHDFVGTVGTGGYISFGGYGAWSRLHGLAQDRVIGAEVVLANGTLLTVSKDNHPDLFWAVRGAAPSFCIVTEWIFATLPTTSDVVPYVITFPKNLAYEQISEIHQRWQDIVVAAPEQNWLATRVERDISTPQDLVLTAQDWYGGIIAPLSDEFPRQTLFAKSLMTPGPVGKAACDSVAKYWTGSGRNASASWWFETYSYGGAISRQGVDDTAYAHRDQLFNYHMWVHTPEGTPLPSDSMQFLNNMYTALEPNPQAAYPNYVDPTLTKAEWSHQYYGAHYKRLTKIKSAVDPENVFRFPQAVEQG
ncbi:Hexose oxidase [Rhizoctonia solani]|uniref:Hexose oxidase n=1 Tax=Rhizoctonia solani TaxID=456999 RepID=A0A0K6FYW4_9AGAM|nr:Hexose oxidase [Rhizoctonia solani]